MKTAFITGTTSGIGLATTQLLDKQGWQVFAGVLPGENTAALQKNASQDLHIIEIDITKSDVVYDAIHKIEKIVGNDGLDALVNNAGIGITGPMETLPMAAIRKQMDVNYFGHVQVTQAALPLIRLATGRIINVTSILGRVVTPFAGPYCSSKFAMEAFTDAIRLELAPWNIHVSAIEPTVIKTGIWEQTRSFQDEIIAEMNDDVRAKYGAQMTSLRDSTHQEEKSGVSPSQVAATILKALTDKNPKTRYGVGDDFRLLSLIARFAPDKLLDSILLRRLGLQKNNGDTAS